jgi:DNA-binding GntR family transcriptional regulator
VAGFVRRDDGDADLALGLVAGLNAAAGANRVTERVTAGHAAPPLALERLDLAIKRAALRRDPGKLEAIQKAFESSEQPSQDSPSRHFRSGDQIHAFIFESIGNQRLMEIYQRLQDHIVRHRIHFFSNFHVGRSEESYKEHLEILDALAAQDPARCEQAIKVHLRNSLEYIKSII